MEQFQQDIRLYKAKHNLTQEGLSELAGVSRRLIGSLERGEPSISKETVRVASVVYKDNDTGFVGAFLEMAGLKQETPAEPEG